MKSHSIHPTQNFLVCKTPYEFVSLGRKKHKNIVLQTERNSFYCSEFYFCPVYEESWTTVFVTYMVWYICEIKSFQGKIYKYLKISV